jgi:hypothetical protein
VWQYVIPHFNAFLGELQLSDRDRADAFGKAERIAKSLFTKYYPNLPFDQNSYVVVGSLGKETAARPRTDLDMLFVLPGEVYNRIETLTGNKHSALLQEVKRALLVTFPNTNLSADGQVIVAPFQTYSVDIVPAFRFGSGPNTGSYLTAHTGDGGSWRLSNPVAESNWLKSVDAVSGGKATDLIKMLKAWKRECNVEMKSICLEVAATVFVNQWVNRANGIGYGYHDYLVRDFFGFLLNYVNGRARPAGVEEWIPLGDCWHTKCQAAYNRAMKACDYEQADHGLSAVLEWQKIFGSQLTPRMPYLPSLVVAR